MAARKNTTISEEARQKIGNAHRGRKRSDKELEAIKAGCNTPESKERRRASHLNKKLSDEHKAAIKAGLNKPETRALRSEIASNRTHTEETKQKLKEIMHSPDVNAKISKGVSLNYSDPEYKESHRLASLAAITPEYRQKMSKSVRQVQATDEWKKHHTEGMKKAGHIISAKAIQRWESLTDDEKAEWVVIHMPPTISGLEDTVAQILDRLGIKYDRQYKVGWYNVDFYIASFNLVIEANGCYWHGCEKCGFENIKKRQSDARRLAYLTKKGYTVVTFWEHEINGWEV